MHDNVIICMFKRRKTNTIKRFTNNRKYTSSSGEEVKKDPLELTVTLQSLGVDNETTQVHKAWQEMMNEKMGREVKLDIDYIPSGEYGEKGKMLVTSNDITDIFTLPSFYDWKPAAQDGMFVDLAPYQDKMPNYMTHVKSANDGMARAIDGDGKMYAIFETFTPRFPADKGINTSNVTAYRYDVFEANKIKIPETLDELYDAAKKLKELFPDKYPINTRWKVLDPIFFANHTYNGRYWNGEKYIYGATEEAYKEALQFLNKLYSEKLLDPEYMTDTDDTIKSKALNDKNYIWLTEWFTSPGDYTRLANEEKIFAVTFWPSNPKYGEKAWQRISANNVTDMSAFTQFVVSIKAKEVEEIVKLIDLQYSDDVLRLITWGIEGVTYTLDDKGEPHFVDEFKNAPDVWEEGNKTGMRTSSKSRPGLQMSADAKAWVDMAADDYLYYEGALHIEPFEKSEYYLNMPYPDNEYIPPEFFGPQVQLTADEKQEYTKIMTAVDTYRDEMQSKFIKGEMSFDKWDKYQEDMKKMGDVDTAMEIYNTAADRYFAAKNK